MKKIIYPILLLLLPMFLFAQTDTTGFNALLDMSLEELMNQEIYSVSKSAENVLEAPQTVIIISSEEIQRRGYIDLEQLFHDLPGFDISRGNGTQYSQVYQRGYRSKNTERTSFQIDGVEENDLWSNSVWLSRQYPLSNIKRVEIIYGPSATMYGANAFLGVINIVTKSAKDITGRDKNFGVNAESSYGSWNTWYSDVSLAARYKQFSIVATGRIYQSDEMDLSNFEDWDYDLTNYDINFYKEKLDTQDNNIAQIAMDLDKKAYYNDSELNGKSPSYSNNTNDYLFNVKIKLSDFTLGVQHFRRDEGYGAWYRDDYELGTENGGRWVPENTFIYGKYEKNITDKLTITSRSTFKQHQLTGDCEEYYYIGYLNGGYGIADLTDETGNVLPEDQRVNPYWWHAWYHTYSQQFRSALRLVYNPNHKLSIVSGVEYRSSYIQGNYIYGEEKIPEETAPSLYVDGGNHFFSQDIGIFAQAKYSPINSLSIVTGGRLDNNKIRLTGGYGTQIDPKFAVIYTPSDFIIKGIYSEAFMDAGYWTKFGTTPGRLLNNPTLEPEKVRNSEISFGWKVNDFLYAEMLGYNSNFEGAVGTQTVIYEEDGTTIETTQHQPIGNLQIQGVQSRLNFKYNNYSAYANYTFSNPYKIEDGNRIRIGDIASHQVNLGFNVLYFRKLNINLRTNLVGAKPTGENTTVSSNPVNEIDAYFILNGAISYTVYKRISLQVSVNNILDRQYFHPGVRSANGDYYSSQIPQNERNFMGKLIIEI